MILFVYMCHCLQGAHAGGIGASNDHKSILKNNNYTNTNNTTEDKQREKERERKRKQAQAQVSSIIYP